MNSRDARDYVANTWATNTALREVSRGMNMNQKSYDPMMLLTLTNRLQLLANMRYIMKTLSNKADFKNCQYLDGEIDELIISNVYPSKHGLEEHS